ncbi:MAG: DSD1 family PLP-dependent enzyme [Vicinamibacterales bacterium]
MRGIAGYTAAEMRRKASGESIPERISKWELDTPALCVDLDKLERNIETMRVELAARGLVSRPHAKTHKCAAIARLQLAGGSIGICAAKVSEAEALFANGIEPILMTTSNVTPVKIRRAMALRKVNPLFIQAVDNPQNACDLSEAAREEGVVADVVVDVAAGTRTGVPPDDRALALAQMVDSLPGLKLRGMIAYDGSVQHVRPFQVRREKALANAAPHARVFEAMKRAGLNTEIFSGGGTGTYNIMHEVPGLTDVQVGSYIFMDNQYIAIGSVRNDDIFDDFEPSLTVIATVVNAYWRGRLTTDAGAKALTIDTPAPSVVYEPGFRYTADSDEFGKIEYETAGKVYEVGDKLEIVPPHCDPVVNLYDQIYATRGDLVEAVWPVTARGCSR